jgi:hypothetical protein
LPGRHDRSKANQGHGLPQGRWRLPVFILPPSGAYLSISGLTIRPGLVLVDAAHAVVGRILRQPNLQTGSRRSRRRIRSARCRRSDAPAGALLPVKDVGTMKVDRMKALVLES